MSGSYSTVMRENPFDDVAALRSHERRGILSRPLKPLQLKGEILAGRSYSGRDGPFPNLMRSFLPVVWNVSFKYRRKYTPVAASRPVSSFPSQETSNSTDTFQTTGRI